MNQLNGKKPIIGVTANLMAMPGRFSMEQERACLNQEYILSILKAQAVPILLPILADQESIHRQVELVDALVLSGGYDVSPLLYGEEPDPKLEAIYPQRDEYEIQIIKIAYQMGKPILGICRGLQILNVVFGGSLYQDLSYYQSKNSIQHIQQTHMANGSHTIDLIPQTKLHQIFKTESLIANSSHHQAVKELAPGFIVSARSKDGLIEGIEKKESSFVIGVQWHPETMVEQSPEMLKLFEALTAKAREL